MFKNNLKLGYVLFVGVPLLILVGVLRAGANLTAPPAISGDWSIEASAKDCASPSTMSIYQTGPDLLVMFNGPQKTTFAGTVEGGRIRATSNISGCGCAARVEAAIDGNPGRRSLRGQLLFDGCSACAPIPFRAARSGR